VNEGVAITLQEAWLERGGSALPVDVPDFIAETIERVAFLARTDKRIDQRSGVSQRMPISVLENAVSNAERRALMNERAGRVVPRSTDIYAALPSITGKLELEYEGELVGAESIARELIALAAAETFDAWGGEATESFLQEVVDYFDTGGVLQLGDTASARRAVDGFGTVPGLIDAVREIGLGQRGVAGPHGRSVRARAGRSRASAGRHRCQ
jgi:magnesium chelatase subunit I